MKQIRFTKEGFNKLKNDYKDLLGDRPLAVLDLKKAREMGDLSENGYYKAARAKLSEIDRRLRTALFEIKSAIVIDGNKVSVVGIGSKVALSNNLEKVEYSIVGDLEADPKLRKISLLSPIGKALEGKKAGEFCEIDTPSGKLNYKIIKVF